MTIHELRRYCDAELKEIYSASESAALFSVFAEKILNINRFQLRLNTGEEVSDEQLDQFREVISELKTGKPYQHITGEAVFYGLNFEVNENVLIPRPETEELLELAIEKITAHFGNSGALKILDIGTGSGVIPIILKKNFPGAQVKAMDYSEKALDVARRNAAHHGTAVDFVLADYLNTALDETFDVIISNPPYIGRDETQEIGNPVKDFEPHMALFSPTEDALLFYRKIAAESRQHLAARGLVFLEINQKLGRQTLELFADTMQANLLRDLSGNDRFIVAVGSL